MNTRSRARAEREVRRSIEKQRRIERKERFASRDNVVNPYKLRSTMGRKGGNSTFKGEKTFDIAAVAPIVLFPVSEEDNPVQKGCSEVLFMCITKDIYLFANTMFNSIMEISLFNSLDN